jgi:hypothetical protein
MTARNGERIRQEQRPFKNMVIEIQCLEKKVNNMLIEPD